MLELNLNHPGRDGSLAGKGLWSHAPADVTLQASGFTSNTSQRNQKGISLFKVYMGLIMIIKDTIPRVPLFSL